MKFSFCGLQKIKFVLQYFIVKEMIHMKRIVSFFLSLLILIIFSLESFASVLGSSMIDGYTVTVGKGTTFTKQVFYSDQSGVGRQTEHYITYQPSADVEPIITHGTHLFGSKKISDETSRLSNSVLILGK